YETNEIVASAIRIIGLFILMVGVLCWINVFDIYPYIINSFIAASFIPLILPTVLVNVLHKDGKWVKYVIVTCIIVFTGIAYVIFTFQTVLLFVIPSIISAFYLDKKVMWYTGICTIVNIVISHFITGFKLFQPWIEPFTDLQAIMLYGAVPRIIQYICATLLLYFLCSRVMKFFNSFYEVIREQQGPVEEEDNIKKVSELDKVLSLLTEREKSVFELLIRGYTNAQIASQLYLSVGTVKNYVSGIYDKVEIRDRTALVVKYSQYYHTYD
ncbi:MAG: LuxR C-terminal-related transcriptional regulator, partial [Cellulosilyticaceae bacterium]